MSKLSREIKPDERSRILKRADDLIFQSKQFESEREYHMAIQSLMTAIKIHKNVLGPTHPLLVNDYVELADLLDHIDDIDQSIHYFRLALQIRIKRPLKRDIIDYYSRLGNALLKNADYEEALYRFNQCLPLIEQFLHGEFLKNFYLSMIVTGIITSLTFLGKIYESIPFLRQKINLDKEDDHNPYSVIDLANALQFLENEKFRPNYTEVILLLKEALHILNVTGSRYDEITRELRVRISKLESYMIMIEQKEWQKK
jgi:tetratricopeptide (TPR) repeat protein